MKRRRLHFAAPLVLVTTTSCGQPAPVEAPPSPPIEGMDHVRDVPRDAGVEVAPPIDAAAGLMATTGSPLIVTIIVPEHTEQPKGYISCHDFGPGNRGCNPPRPQHHPEERRTRRILAVETKGEDVVITFGTEDGDPVETGMAVWARTRTDRSRTRVGYVDRVGNVDARLVVALSEAEVQDGAHIDIQADPKGVGLVTAKIIDVEVSGASTIITIGAGRKDGVDRGWRVDVVHGGGRPMPGGDAIVYKVTERTSYAKVKLTRDQIHANPQVRLRPGRAD